MEQNNNLKIITNEIEKLKKNDYYVEVAYRDFKGRMSRLQDLCTSIRRLGIKVSGYDYEDNYKGWAMVPHATEEEIKTLHERYGSNVEVEGCYLETLDDMKYVKNNRKKRIERLELALTIAKKREEKK